MADETTWLTLDEAAERLGVTAAVVYAALRRGELCEVRLQEPREWRVDETSLDGWNKY